MTTQKLKIEGMTCNGCANGVTRALQSVPGVTGVRVSLAEGSAEVDSPATIDTSLLTGAVEQKGFRAVPAQ